MGVPGLWDVLNKVGKSTSMAKLAAIDGFEQNASGRRAYRIGIDVSIWFHHAYYSKEGENPELRGLFFRLAALAKMSIIPLFVFDGRQRPSIKRGSKLGKSGSHGLSRQFKQFLDAFGMEWREALGEAEAELAFLNQEGHIDAIMTDDCDAFVFGARTIVKNISSKLSGNKGNLATNSNDKTDKFHAMAYRAIDIKSNPEVALTRGGLILFALLAGGDYHKGVDKVGKVIAHALARCEFGDELLEAYQNLPNYEFNEFLGHWRSRVNIELKENKRGFLLHRTSLSLPDRFPELDVLEKYAKPLNSGNGRGASSSVALRDRTNLDLGQIAHLCEQHFEWGYREKIIERFNNVMWPAAVMQVLRRAALEVDENERRQLLRVEVGTPASLVKRYLGKDRTDRFADAFVNRGSAPQYPTDVVDVHPLITKIVGSRQHASTDGTLEYRIEVSPVQLVQITNAGIRGTRSEPPPKEGGKRPKKVVDPSSVFRIWIPASILRHVHPTMVQQYVADQSNKRKGKRKQRTLSVASMSDDDSMALSSFPSSAVTPSTSMLREGSSQDQHHVRKTGGERPVLDPWFTSPSIPRPGTARTPGFLFTFPNPDPVQLEDEESMIMDGMDEEIEASQPLTRFERLCDQILNAPTKPTRPTKSKKRKAVEKVDVNPKFPQPSKKPRTSILDVLDDFF